MSDLQEKFEKAAKEVQTLEQRPDNETLLKLYSLYKQGSQGDISGERPGFADFKGRAKYDAWAKLQGMPREEAMKKYIDLVAERKDNPAGK